MQANKWEEKQAFPQRRMSSNKCRWNEGISINHHVAAVMVIINSAKKPQ